MKWKAIAGVSAEVAVGVILLVMAIMTYKHTQLMPVIDSVTQPQVRNWVTDELDEEWLIDTNSIQATIFTPTDNWRYFWTQNLIGQGVHYDRKLKNPEERSKGLKLVITNNIYSCENSDVIAVRTLTLVENNRDYELRRSYSDPRDRMRALPSQQPKGTNSEYSKYFELILARCRQAGVKPKF